MLFQWLSRIRVLRAFFFVFLVSGGAKYYRLGKLDKGHYKANNDEVRCRFESIIEFQYVYVINKSYSTIQSHAVHRDFAEILKLSR